MNTLKDKPRVLIVDDNPFNRDLLKKFLQPEGILVDEAKNGKDALEQLKTADYLYSLIFMDLIMPGMDGFETMQRIRSMEIQTPIIISSAMSSKEDRQRCIEAGGNDFLPKPIDIDKIKAILKKYDINRPAGFWKPRRSQENDRDTSSPAAAFSDYHILLVEEDAETADQYYAFLKHAGFEITRVLNGNQAWELFQEHKYTFNIIISNVFTSGIDGFGIVAKIKRDYSNVLVFIYAEDYDTDMFELAVKLGADGIVTQDTFEDEITELIESAIYRSRQRGTRNQSATTVSQVRKAQAQLIRYGCPTPCQSIDIAYSSLSDAGGDIACCRRFNLAGRCGILVGDVAGHNVMSSYVSAFALGILTSNWNSNQHPMDLLKIINSKLNLSDYEQSHFCTAALLWDRYRKKIDISSAGSPGVLIVEKRQNSILSFRELDGGGMCLGLLKEDHLFLKDDIHLNTGDYFFLFSDGITSSDIIEILLSGKVALIRENIRGLSQEIIDGILEKRRQDDDMILISMEQNDSFRENGLHYQFLSSYEEADKASRWVAEQCIPEKIPSGKDPHLCICLGVREALINAVRHGNNFNPNAFVDLSIYVSPKELRIDISDEGSGFEIPDKIPQIGDINVLQSGGRGLSVMNSVADVLEVNGGTVSLIFREKVKP